MQIAAICRAIGAEVIHSEDEDLVKLLAGTEIKVLRVTDLPMPPPKQTELFEKTGAASVTPMPSPTQPQAGAVPAKEGRYLKLGHYRARSLPFRADRPALAARSCMSTPVRDRRVLIDTRTHQGKARPGGLAAFSCADATTAFMLIGCVASSGNSRQSEAWLIETLRQIDSFP